MFNGIKQRVKSSLYHMNREKIKLRLAHSFKEYDIRDIMLLIELMKEIVNERKI